MFRRQMARSFDPAFFCVANLRSSHITNASNCAANSFAPLLFHSGQPWASTRDSAQVSPSAYSELKGLLTYGHYLAKIGFPAGAVVMLPEQLERGDLALIEGRRDIRIIINLPGRYSLADRRDARGERRQFACRTVNISKDAMVLAAPVNGKLGERVIADIDELGRLQGNV